MIADKDLLSIQQARILAETAFEAQKKLAAFSQEKLDAIVEAVAAEADRHAQSLAVISQDETGYGNWQDKLVKNRFACRELRSALRGLRCVGVLTDDRRRGLMDIGVPLGVIVALCPATSPVSTLISTVLLAIKSGNSLIVSPHPKALKTMLGALELLGGAARQHGLPEGCLSWLDTVSKSGTAELMRHKATSMILMTGVCGMVETARATGKPFIYGGMGNGPAFVERTADIEAAVADIIRSKTFDFGTAPSAEQSLVVDGPVAAEVRRALQAQDAYIMTDDESVRLAALCFEAGRLNRRFIGQSAVVLARAAGFGVPERTRLLVAERKYVNDADPYSREWLAPVLALYVEEDWMHACEKCIELLLHERNAHTLSIHSRDEAVIHQFALKKPVGRLLVNTPASFGGMGMSTHLFPAMTLGSGVAGYGITSDNVSPLHLVYTRKVGYGVGKEPGLSRLSVAAAPAADARRDSRMDSVQEVLRTVIHALDAQGEHHTL